MTIERLRQQLLKMNLAGQAFSRGFFIQTVGGTFVFLAPKSIQPNEKFERNKRTIGILQRFCVVILTLLFFAAYAHVIPRLEMTILFFVSILTVMFSLMSAITVVIFFTLSQKKHFKEWHGCEHKVINLISSKLPITVENLRSCNTLDLRCGSFIWGSVVQVTAALWTLSVLRSDTLHGVVTAAGLKLLLFSTMLFLAAIAYPNAMTALPLKIQAAAIFLMLPAFPFPFLLQVLVVSEPSEEKMKFATERLRKLKQKHENSL